MKANNTKEIAKIDRQLDRLDAEFATIKKRANELTAEFKRLSPEYTKLMERTEQINKSTAPSWSSVGHSKNRPLGLGYLPRISNAGRSLLRKKLNQHHYQSSWVFL